jgi:hypothetical protein
MKDLLVICGGFIATMLTNVLLGSTLATLQKNWSWKKFWSGFYKIATIIAGVCLLYLAFYLNPTIQVVSLGGVNMNLLEALKTIFTAGIVTYGALDLKKLVEIFKLKVTFDDVVDKDMISIPKENEIKKED